MNLPIRRQLLANLVLRYIWDPSPKDPCHDAPDGR